MANWLYSATVTVTEPASTIYVTVGAGATSSSVKVVGDAAVSTTSTAVAASATSTSAASSSDDTGDDDTCDDDGEGDDSGDDDDDTCDDDGEGDDSDDDDTCAEETVTATVVPAAPTNATGSAYPTGAALKNRFAKLH